MRLALLLGLCALVALGDDARLSGPVPGYRVRPHVAIDSSHLRRPRIRPI